jgi:hypothetical protein
LTTSFSLQYAFNNSANTLLLSFGPSTLGCSVAGCHLNVALGLCGINHNVRMVGGKRGGERKYTGHLFTQGAAPWAASIGALQLDIKRME